MLVLVSLVAAARAWGSDPIGLEALRAADPTLTGSGMAVAQAEAIGSGTDGFEVNPSAVGVSGSNFIYISARGMASTFPNSVGSESGHADTVADYFYGDLNTSDPEGVAYGVKQIVNYDAGYFYGSIVSHWATARTGISTRIVNQSYVFKTGTNTAEQKQMEQDYDNYAAKFNVLFVSGVGNGNGDPVLSPGSAYNGIGVAAYGGLSSVGPTYDGRSKPDITAPADATSFSTPQVSGAAAILMQAGTRGDGGAGTATAATDARTLKALLLNGAVKPADWATSGSTQPLDPRYGAGILNVYNSYENLHAGKVVVSGSMSGAISATAGSSYLPDEGWDLATIGNSLAGDSSYLAETNYYEFNLTAATAPAFTLTGTITWWKQVNAASINNLDLYLFDADTGTEVALSNSTVDNVEQIYFQNLAPGHYELGVLKNGGATLGSAGLVSQEETYALAYDFAAVPEPPVAWMMVAGVPAAWAGRRLFANRPKGV